MAVGGEPTYSNVSDPGYITNGNKLSSVMPHRDPQTGQFVTHDGMDFEDYETLNFAADLGVEASNLGGGTSFGGGDNNSVNGIELAEYDTIVDRSEEAHFMGGWHRIVAYINSTETADGTLRTVAEVSTAASPQWGLALSTNTIEGSVVGDSDSDDSIDLIGRQMKAVSTGPFSDSSTGVGGGGTAGTDEYSMGPLPGAAGRFQARDDLFLNVRFDAWNVDDAGIHLELVGQHVYGINEM